MTPFNIPSHHNYIYCSPALYYLYVHILSKIKNILTQYQYIISTALLNYLLFLKIYLFIIN